MRQRLPENDKLIRKYYLITGLNGAGISLRANLFQSKVLKNACLLSSFASSSPPPSLFLGSFTKSLLIKSDTSLPRAKNLHEYINEI